MTNVEKAQLAVEWAQFAMHDCAVFDRPEVMPDQEHFISFGMAMTSLPFLDRCNADTEDRPWYRAFFGLRALPGFIIGQPVPEWQNHETDPRLQTWANIMWGEQGWCGAQLVNAGAASRDDFDRYVRFWIPRTGWHDEQFWAAPSATR